MNKSAKSTNSRSIKHKALDLIQSDTPSKLNKSNKSKSIPSVVVDEGQHLKYQQIIDADGINAAADEMMDNLGVSLDNLKPTGNRKHSPEIKRLAKALYSVGYSTSTISNHLGLSNGMVHTWVNGFSGDDVEVSEIAEKIKRNMSDRLMMMANIVLAKSMDEDKLKKASTLQLVTSSGILLEKHRLFAGESTANISLNVRKVDDLNDKIGDADLEIARLTQELQS